MADVKLNDLGEGRFVVEGDMTFKTARELARRSEAAFEDHTEIEVDLAGVAGADSAGLALMLEWINWANHSVREIRFINIPKRIRSIAMTSDVQDLLHIGERWTGFIEPTLADDTEDDTAAAVPATPK